MNDPQVIQAHKEYYEAVFADLDIVKIHDCSMGSGGLTFPLCELGYEVSGSDINENILIQGYIFCHPLSHFSDSGIHQNVKHGRKSCVSA